MNIQILRASKNDIPLIHEMQVSAFMPLYVNIKITIVAWLVKHRSALQKNLGNLPPLFLDSVR